MLDNYEPTAAERRAIEAGYAVVAAHSRSEVELMHHVKAEHRGYGFAKDRIPMLAAKAMIVRWFTDGVQSPNVLLRDAYAMRPSAVWAMGRGAERAPSITFEELQTLRAACRAHSEAFGRNIATV